MNISSKLIENAVNAFASLPSIGKKTALRLCLHLLQEDKETVAQFADAILKMREHIRFCKDCHNVSDGLHCSICENPRRNREVVCIVEGIKDIMAIENTQQFNGLYHVLGGVIAPIEGIGPSDLNIDTLLTRLEKGEIKELVMALNATIEGDTTTFYLARQVQPYNLKISTIARGVSFGGELEYADELTLGRSIAARIPYKSFE